MTRRALPPANPAPPPASAAPLRLEMLLERARTALQPAGDPDETQGRRVEQKALAARLEEEIRATASRIGGGLSLLREPVQWCARLFEACGELARAAGLLSDAGMRDQSVQLAEKAGDLELLERDLAAIHGPDERAHAASVAFTAYEATLMRGHFTEALAALDRAIGARPDNPTYADLRRRLLARRPARVVLQAPEGLLALAVCPAWIGRGDDVAVRLRVPGLSRKHAVAMADEQRASLTGQHGELLWQDAIGRGRHGVATRVKLGALEVDVRAAGMGVVMQAEALGTTAMMVSAGGSAPLDGIGLSDVEVGLRWPAGGFPRLALHGATLVVDGEAALAGGRDLATGATVLIAGREFQVV